MIYREALITDIPQLSKVRLSVKENVLSNPDLVPYEDYAIFLTQLGKGWVCEMDDRMVGFAIVDMKDNNIWALFIDPEYEKKGIGRQLHDTMLDWYFRQTKTAVWLGTAPNSRAENFYSTAGWQEIGLHGKGEIKFEMTAEIWHTQNLKR